jgi:16S rRNA (adenine(1408)-N(1))-methyltransferase
MDNIELQKTLAGFEHVALDLGTGDGRFVCKSAEQNRDQFFIGLDSCREILRTNSRKAPVNALFVIASAQSLPSEMAGLASHVSINFPWGSLLESLLNADACLVHGLSPVTRPFADMNLHLNADALASAGWRLEPGADQVERVLNGHGWRTTARSLLTAGDLRTMPTTWAKRLAVGRDPRAVRLCFKK